MATLDYHITFYHHAHLGAVTSIYAHHVLHGRASFEEVPPSEGRWLSASPLCQRKIIHPHCLK